MITIDEQRGTVTVDRATGTETYELGEPEAFRILSEAWLRSGWVAKHAYTFTWLGRPVIQLPEDMFRVQELIWTTRPDVIIETGVAHGGSLIFYASLCRVLGTGKIVGVDIEIRPGNRVAIESHPLAELITLVEGDSIAPETVERVASACADAASVVVFLDSRHTKTHVLRELELYSRFVNVGSYLIAMDGGIMELVRGAARTDPDWDTNNPKAAAAEFVVRHPDFELYQPPFLFSESNLSQGVSYFSGGWVRRVR